jgi:hypothetical protein
MLNIYLDTPKIDNRTFQNCKLDKSILNNSTGQGLNREIK